MEAGRVAGDWGRGTKRDKQQTSVILSTVKYTVYMLKKKKKERGKQHLFWPCTVWVGKTLSLLDSLYPLPLPPCTHLAQSWHLPYSEGDVAAGGGGPAKPKGLVEVLPLGGEQDKDRGQPGEEGTGSALSAPWHSPVSALRLHLIRGL